MMNLNVSIAKSMEECPPEKSVTEEGVNWKDRRILSRNQVEYLIEDQPRETSVSPDHIDDLKLSYRNGFLHDRDPQAVKEHPTIPNLFVGRKGFNRYAALTQLNVKEMVYDVVSFDTLYDEYVYIYESNETLEHTTPVKENEVITIIKGILNGLEQGIITFEDGNIVDYKKEIYAFMERAYKEHPHLWKKVYNSVKNLKGPYKGMAAYNQDGANAKMAELSLPYGGAYNTNLFQPALGYVSKNKPGKSITYDTKQLLLNGYMGQKVYLTSYIDNPNPKNINDARQTKEDEFKKNKKYELDWVKYLLGDGLVEEIDLELGEDSEPFLDRVEKAFDKNYPIIHNGFLPQRFEEKGLVDKNGNSMKSKI